MKYECQFEFALDQSNITELVERVDGGGGRGYGDKGAGTGVKGAGDGEEGRGTGEEGAGDGERGSGEGKFWGRGLYQNLL